MQHKMSLIAAMNKAGDQTFEVQDDTQFEKTIIDQVKAPLFDKLLPDIKRHLDAKSLATVDSKQKFVKQITLKK